MILTPTAIGLILCDYVLVEQETKKVSLIGSFQDVGAEQFPAILPPFFVYAALTDGFGSGTLELVLSRSETDEEIFSHRNPISLPNQLAVLRVRVRVRNCSIPAPGAYQFMLLADGAFVAQRQMRVYLKGGSQ